MYYTTKSSIFISSKMSKHLVSCMIISYLSAAGGCAFPCLPDVIGRGTWEPAIGFCNGFRAANISANVGLNFESLQCKRVEFNHQKMKLFHGNNKNTQHEPELSTVIHKPNWTVQPIEPWTGLSKVQLFEVVEHDFLLVREA